MKTIWDRIDSWLLANAPDVYEDLQPGVQEEAITLAESALGIYMPEDVRDSYRIHNGQKHPFGTPSKDLGLIEGWALLSLDKVVKRWQLLRELRECGDFDDRRSEASSLTVTDWWHPKWIPITYDGNSDSHCIDLNPAANGVFGQIIIFWHDWEKRQVVANSFREWLSAFATDLESGYFTVTERANLQRRR